MTAPNEAAAPPSNLIAFPGAGPEAAPINNVLAAFLDTADSPETRRSYERAIRAALATFNVESLHTLDGTMLAAWRRQVIESGGAPNTQKAAVVALRAFLRFARVVGACHLPDDVLRVALKTPKGGVQHAYAVLSEPEIARLIAATRYVRDRAIL